MLIYDSYGTTDFILEHLNDSGMSDRKFAEKIGVSPQAICSWRGHRSCAAIEQIVSSAGVLGIEPGDLLMYNER